MGRARRRIAKVALALGVCVLCALALELSWRVFLFGSNAFSFRMMDSVRDFGKSGLVQRSAHREIIFELKPNLDAWYQLVAFRTNSRGLRDDEYSIDKPPRTFRIAVVGDSYTMPAGVSLEDAYHSRLERWLNERSSTLRYEFLNFGVAGYFLRQYRAVIHEKAIVYDPDLVLIGFCGRNDHHIRGESAYQEPYQAKATEHPFFRLTFFERLVHAFEFRVLRHRNPGVHQSPERQRNYLRRHFEALGRLSDREGIPFVVALIDTRRSPVREDLPEILAEAGIEYVDASAPLVGKDPDDFAIYPTDEHPNAEANRIFAEEIGAFLLQRRLVPAVQPKGIAEGRRGSTARATPKRGVLDP